MFDSFVRLSVDSLLIASNQFEQYIAISLIENIAIRKESHAIKKGAGIGFVTGVVVGGLLGWSLDAALSQGSYTSEAPRFIAIGAGIGGVGGTVIGTTIGLIVGAYKGKDKNHDMTGWLTAQKKAKIQEIMNSEK